MVATGFALTITCSWNKRGTPAGASLGELKHRLGQSTTQAAAIYLHATVDHGRRIAERMDELAAAPSNVRPIGRSARAPR